jgi:hypothetical protein
MKFSVAIAIAMITIVASLAEVDAVPVLNHCAPKAQMPQLALLASNSAIFTELLRIGLTK